MLTCKDCLHVELCVELATLEQYYTGLPTVHDHSYAHKCDKFTHKDKYVEVVHAHWEDGCAVDPKTGRIIYKSIDCSNCEEIFKIESHDREYWKKRFKVCPFCGAVMDGGNEDV